MVNKVITEMTNNSKGYTHNFGYFATFAESLHCEGVLDTIHGHIVDQDHSVIFTEQHHERLLENVSIFEKMTSNPSNS